MAWRSSAWASPTRRRRESVAKRLTPLFPARASSSTASCAALLVYLQGAGRGRSGDEAAAERPDAGGPDVLCVRAPERRQPAGSDEQRRAYFSWINLAERGYRGGNSFKKFLQQIRDDATAKLTEAERVALKDVIEGKQKVEVVKLETTRQFVHNWQMEDLLPVADQVESGRSFEKGRAAYEAAQCAKCHRFAGEGGDTGPDITGVGNRFNAGLPARIADRAVEGDLRSVPGLRDSHAGRRQCITGRVIEESDKEIKVRTDPFARELLDDRQEQHRSPPAIAPQRNAARPDQHAHQGRDPRPDRLHALRGQCPGQGVRAGGQVAVLSRDQTWSRRAACG